MVGYPAAATAAASARSTRCSTKSAAAPAPTTNRGRPSLQRLSSVARGFCHDALRARRIVATRVGDDDAQRSWYGSRELDELGEGDRLAAEVNTFAVPVAAEVEHEGHLGGRMGGRDGSGALDARPKLGDLGVDQPDGRAGRHPADGRKDVADAVRVLARVTQRWLVFAAAVVAHGDENADRIGARPSTYKECGHQARSADPRFHGLNSLVTRHATTPPKSRVRRARSTAAGSPTRSVARVGESSKRAARSE